MLSTGAPNLSTRRMTSEMSGSSKQGPRLDSATQLIDTHSKLSQHMRKLDAGLVFKLWEFNSFSSSALDKCDSIFLMELCQQTPLNGPLEDKNKKKQEKADH